MAQRWAQYLKGDLVEPRSAGVNARAPDPRAVAITKQAEAFSYALQAWDSKEDT